MTGPSQILVVDDFLPFREWVVSAIQGKPAWRLIAEASDGLEAVQAAERLRPDLIILDVGLPKLNGLAAARRIHKGAPDAKILFLSQETSVDVVAEALSLGAGYVLKAVARAELGKAIQAVLQGKRYISKGLPAAIYTERSYLDGESA